MKHPQFILAVKAELVRLLGLKQGFNPLRLDHDLDLATRNLIIGQREALEGDPSFRQLLPYVVITQLDEDGIRRVFSYRRAKGIGENRLLGNHSIGFGGHIDLDDACVEDSQIDLWQTVIQSAGRELMEELGIEEVYADNLVNCSWGTIVDDSNSVGVVHLGLAFLLELPQGLELDCQELELEMMLLAEPGDLLADHITGKLVLENWSIMLLGALASDRADT